MLAGRDSPSPLSSGLSETQDRMSYLSAMTVPERLAGSGLPVEMFGIPAHTQSVELRLESEQEEQDSEYRELSLLLFIVIVTAVI